ncbi:AraC family transcriptional regulator [Chelativorans sp. AA-79]|uniref:AraC family transcriptional regulator n=1 Tax=Chelativorans sp. AA-79 TaxID=3028735 RepID=UPI0023F6E02C|nr:AraC family transcriptional regulator [Chelativorans sp. AA-79]WEX10951.1 AraC family transcriptional regulator [Chelativorans sp. AA-79]
MDALKDVVRNYAAHHANNEGLALTPVPGLRMMCVESPPGDLHSIYRPLVCLVLQGAKRMTVGREQHVFFAGQSVIVSADMPVVGRIVQASPDEPYIAIAVELEMATLRELAAHLGDSRAQRPSEIRTLFSEHTNDAVLDCAMRLMQLIDRPDAMPLLRPGIMRELHYWLLSGQHGRALRALAAPDGHESRLAAAIAILREEYRSRIPVERLATAAAMSLTAFYKHFRHMTSLTPGQYQKRLRLIEARRLMLEEGFSASSAAFEVGYESVSQFTREYGRLFKASPKRSVLRFRETSGNGAEGLLQAEQANAA